MFLGRYLAADNFVGSAIPTFSSYVTAYILECSFTDYWLTHRFMLSWKMNYKFQVPIYDWIMVCNSS
jgi:hypothetical protein